MHVPPRTIEEAVERVVRVSKEATRRSYIRAKRLRLFGPNHSMVQGLDLPDLVVSSAFSQAVDDLANFK